MSSSLSINSLPSEIIKNEILAKLDPGSVVNFCKTNRENAAILKEDSFWQSYHLKTFGQPPPYFSHCKASCIAQQAIINQFFRDNTVPSLDNRPLLLEACRQIGVRKINFLSDAKLTYLFRTCVEEGLLIEARKIVHESHFNKKPFLIELFNRSIETKNFTLAYQIALDMTKLNSFSIEETDNFFINVVDGFLKNSCLTEARNAATCCQRIERKEAQLKKCLEKAKATNQLTEERKVLKALIKIKINDNDEYDEFLKNITEHFYKSGNFVEAGKAACLIKSSERRDGYLKKISAALFESKKLLEAAKCASAMSSSEKDVYLRPIFEIFLKTNPDKAREVSDLMVVKNVEIYDLIFYAFVQSKDLDKAFMFLGSGGGGGRNGATEFWIDWKQKKADFLFYKYLEEKNWTYARAAADYSVEHCFAIAELIKSRAARRKEYSELIFNAQRNSACLTCCKVMAVACIISAAVAGLLIRRV